MSTPMPTHLSMVISMPMSKPVPVAICMSMSMSVLMWCPAPPPRGVIWGVADSRARRTCTKLLRR
eukprot:15223217-Alexandrium_andersonii.AAC.1